MDTFMYFERAMTQWLVKHYQQRALQRAVHQAYANFARIYPEAVATLFDAHFVNTHLLPMLIKAAGEGNKITTAQIAELWARQVSMLPSLRQKHITAMTPAASHLLCMIADELLEIEGGHKAHMLTINVFAETAVG